MNSRKGMTASPREVQWHCPYCDTTEPTLNEIQKHITKVTEGSHEGISGKSPDKDIVATDSETGEEVDVFDGTDVIRPDDAPLEGVSNRKRIVAAWMVADGADDEEVLEQVDGITDADRSYVRQILRQINRGEVSREYRTKINDTVLDAMESRLTDYNKTTEEPDMSTEETADEITDRDTIDSVSSKNIVINAYKLTGPDVVVKQVWETLSDNGIFDSGYEYFRRTWASTRDGNFSEKEIKNAVDEQLQNIIRTVLRDAGLIDSSSQTVPDEGPREETYSDSEQFAAATASQSASVSSGANQQTESGGVPVEDIEELRTRIDMLRRQVEFEAGDEESPVYRKAEFIASEALDGLDELIDQAS